MRILEQLCCNLRHIPLVIQMMILINDYDWLSSLISDGKNKAKANNVYATFVNVMGIISNRYI